MTTPGPDTPPRPRSAAPLGYHLDAEGLLVPDSAGDSRAFVVGLWSAQTLLVGAFVGGLLLQPWLGAGLRVGVAMAGLALFVSTTALQARAVRRPRATVAGKAASVGAVCVAGAWVVVAVGVAAAGGAGVAGGVGARILVAGVGWVVLMGALAVAYRARMFHWRRPWVAPPR